MSVSFESERKYKAAKKAGKVIVKFTAEWCHPCKSIAPLFEDLAGKYDDITFITIDVDECDDWADVIEVSSMPTFKFYNNGKLIHTIKGAEKSKLRSLIKDF